MRGRIVIGVLLVAIGVAWIMDLQGYEIFPGGFGTWWPSLLILWGIASLITWPYFRSGPIVLITLGGVLQAWRLKLLPENTLAYFLPAFLVLVGLLILVAGRRRRRAWTHAYVWPPPPGTRDATPPPDEPKP